MKKILFGFIILVAFKSIAQETDEAFIRRIANKFVDAIEFTLVDKKGKEFKTSVGYKKQDLQIKSPYLDWLYWNGLFNVGMINLGETLEDVKYSNHVHHAYEFIYEQLPYFTKKNAHIPEVDWWKANPLPSLVQHYIMNDLDHYGTMTAGLLQTYTREKNGKHSKSKYYKEYEHQFEKAMSQVKKQVYLKDSTIARTWDYDKTVWIDDMYMLISFLSRYAEYKESEKLFDFAAKQIIQVNKLLLNQKTGLYCHGYYEDIDRRAPIHWGRANGWMIMAISELLTRLPKDHKNREEIIKIYKDYISNIATYQSAKGLWHQVLDREDSYLETSSTAMFVFSVARGINLSILDPRFASIAQDGWEGLKTKVDENLDIHGICVGTGMSTSIGYYYKRPTPVNDIHGVGAFFKAAAEFLKMQRALEK